MCKRHLGQEQSAAVTSYPDQWGFVLETGFATALNDDPGGQEHFGEQPRVESINKVCAAQSTYLV